MSLWQKWPIGKFLPPLLSLHPFRKNGEREEDEKQDRDIEFHFFCYYLENRCPDELVDAVLISYI
ncbi:MAG: hypothetical protein DRP87_11375 [Spirochaetes bacterium]|nr:MAG: hypothetical protein DRP87_11375 [Spirochaetota bacterium]